MIITLIILSFPLCTLWVLACIIISKAVFHTANGIILFHSSLDILSARRQMNMRQFSTSSDETSEPNNVARFPLASPLLAGSSTSMSLIVVTAGFTRDGMICLLTAYATMLAVMVITRLILTMTVIAEGWLDKPVTMVFSRINAIILERLSVRYLIHGLAAISFVKL